MHRFEKAILRFVLEHGEVTWGELTKNLVETSNMSKGSLSKYRLSMERADWIKQKLNDDGIKVYHVPENRIQNLKKIIDALTPDEQIEMYKSLWLDTLEVIAKASGNKTLKKKQKAAKKLLKHFKK